MKDLKIFCRVEKKYIIDRRKKEKLLSLMQGRITPDTHGNSTICSLYLDTPDFRLIRTSLEREPYKEKLRIRSYGETSHGDRVFLEIKKKYKGRVYKRREPMTLECAKNYVLFGDIPKDTQIMREIDYAMKLYGNPVPRMLVAYEREAYFAQNEENLRITFDTGVRYRSDGLDLSLGSYGKRIIDDDTVIMEIKTDGAMPLWLSHIIDETKTYPSRFSKYGRSYMDMIENITEGEKENVKYLQANSSR